MCWLDCPSLKWVELGDGAYQGWWGEGGACPAQTAESSSGLAWGPGGVGTARAA